MRVAVTGQRGQVVQALIERAGRDALIVPLGRPALDLAAPQDPVYIGPDVGGAPLPADARHARGLRGNARPAHRIDHQV